MFKLTGDDNGFTLLDSKHLTGFTLTELIVVIFLLSLVILATCSVDLTARGFLTSARSQTNAQNEAKFAMDHMVRTMREGINTISVTGTLVQVNMPAPINWIRYQRQTSPDRLEYTVNPIAGPSVTETIATGIVNNPGSVVYFSEPTTDRLVITITVQDGDEAITLTSSATLRKYP